MIYVDGNRLAARAGWVTTMLYVIGDFAEVELLRVVAAVMAITLVSAVAGLLVYGFVVGFVLVWRERRRVRREVVAHVDTLAGDW